MASNFTTIDQIVSDFILTLDGDDYVNNVSDTVVLNVALRGIREFGFDLSKRIKAANLDVSSTNTVTLPSDYVDLITIGVVGQDGLVYVFGENKNKNLLANNSGNLPDYLIGYSDFIYRNFVNSTTDGRLYGYGGGHYSGEYRINIEESRIELTLGTSVSSVYIEYVADEAMTTDYANDPQKVPRYAEEALRAYIYYHLVKRKSNVPAVEKARARQDYYNERRLANARLKSFSKEEALKTIRKNFKQSPKA